MAIQQIGVEQIVKGAKKFQEDMAKYDKSLENATRGTDKYADTTTSKGAQVVKTLSNLAVTAGEVAAQLAIVAAVAIKMAQAIKEGAEIQDTVDSYVRLSGGVEQAKERLEELRVASKGTVSDLDLMTSTAKLMAGATGELRDRLWEAAPALLATAKAAKVVDPSLGSVQEIYRSLVEGIKKGTPLLIDNANVVVKVGEANQRYADALGMTVKEMDSADKQLALLDETLRAGNVLQDQAGKATLTNADALNQLAAGYQNATNFIKQGLATGVMRWIDGAKNAISVLKEWNSIIMAGGPSQVGFSEHSEAVAKSAQTYDQYLASITPVASELRKQGHFVKALTKEDFQLIKAQQELDKISRQVANSTLEGTDVLIRRLEQQKESNNALEEAAIAEEMLRASIEAEVEASMLAADTQQLYKDALDAGIITKKEYELQTALAKAGIGEETTALEEELAIFDANQSAAETLAESHRQLAEAAASAKQEARDQAIATQELAEALMGASNAEIASVAIDMLKDSEEKGLISTEDLIAGMSAIQTEFGLVDEKSSALANSFPAFISAFEDGSIAAEDAGAALQDFILDAEDGNVAVDDLIAKHGELPPSYNSISEAAEGSASVIEVENEKIASSTEESMATTVGAVEEATVAVYDLAAAWGAAAGAAAAAGQTMSIGVGGGGVPSLPSHSGFDATIPPGFPNDSFSLPLAVESGERVTVTPASEVQRQESLGGTFNNSETMNNNYYLTVNTMQSPQTVQRSYRMMQLLGGR
jgi:hypothetical protein